MRNTRPTRPKEIFSLIAITGAALVLAAGLWLSACDEGTVEETTVPSTSASISTAPGTTPTTLPAPALDGIVLYVADGCAQCSSLESQLRDLAGETPVWTRPAEATVNRVPTVVVQFGGRVAARWEGDVAVNNAEAIAAFAAERWPTGTNPVTTTTAPGILVDPEPLEPLFFSGQRTYMVALSDRQLWVSAFQGSVLKPVIANLSSGVWTLSRPTGDHFTSGIAVAPDGTVWVATSGGVFSFDGVEWTRRFDRPAMAVTVDEAGTVWIGGWLDEHHAVPLWLARLDAGSWARVDPTPQAEPGRPGLMTLAVLPSGEVWTAGWGWVGTDLLRYDGNTMEAVTIGDLVDDPGTPEGFSAVSVWDMAAAPDGGLWVRGFLNLDGGKAFISRLDGETWRVYDWPFKDPTPNTFNPVDLAVGPDGVVWLALETGLGSFDGTRWTTHLEGTWISNVAVAPDGAVWYADMEGVHTLGTP